MSRSLLFNTICSENFVRDGRIASDLEGHLLSIVCDETRRHRSQRTFSVLPLMRCSLEEREGEGIGL